LSERRRSPRRRIDQAGFTLMELLITMAVTIIGLMGLLSLHLTTSRGVDVAGRSGEAVSIAQQTVEDLRSRAYKDMVESLTGNRNSSLPLDITLSTVAGRRGMTYARRAVVQEMTIFSPDLIRIRVEISWTDDGAVAGTNNGAYDHVVALELIRTRQETL
jgi:prepilin-type N-terminal cleavage/methylation domain-containing protein